ncbi:3-methyladenine DNA glycosylase [Aliifodinibius sp. S!AR15-10]|uniref:3-methyladenine DNA glycosylase n=1 Tax=Aliifodinibius sp. S!AR15-10 TaxID=2950437 RepID=UPI00286FE742|nr:3-methyladenine DNA glycosylase [Aliifodinibius sp. S!AR15-10]
MEFDTGWRAIIESRAHSCNRHFDRGGEIFLDKDKSYALNIPPKCDIFDAMSKTAIHIDPTFIRKKISPADWRSQAEQHEERISELIDDYLVRRQQQEKDPVIDFLFEYYTFRPSHLKRWSPGFGRLLVGEDFEQLEISELEVTRDGAFLNPDLFPENRKSAVQWILTVLQNSAGNKPSFGCFGMHEWAMVYKADRIRHDQVPLRMSEEELAEFVESRPLVCTHFDAFRFFTDEAQPMNKHEPARDNFQEMEQPGCIHTNMDLYKWAFKMYPWIGSDLIREAFELAMEARFIDMKASPYDLRERGLEPIKIETEEGRLEYVKKQQAIFEKGQPVRDKLIKEYQQLSDYFDC